MLNAVSTIITGALGGQTALQTAINTSAPYAAQTIGSTFGENGSNPNKAAQLFSHAVLGAVVAYVNGGDALGGAVAGAGSEAAAIYLTKTLYPAAVNTDGSVDTSKLSEKEKENIRNLSSAVAAVSSGLAGGSLADAQTGGVIGRNAVENNWLDAKEVNRLVDAGRECAKGNHAGCREWKKLKELDKQRDLALLKACQNPRSATCISYRRQADVALASLVSTPADKYLNPQIWRDAEKRETHALEYSETNTTLLLSQGWTEADVRKEAKNLKIARDLLTDLSGASVITDIRDAQDVSDYLFIAATNLPGGGKVVSAGKAAVQKAIDAAKRTGNLTAIRHELKKLAEQTKQLMQPAKAVTPEGIPIKMDAPAVHSTSSNLKKETSNAVSPDKAETAHSNQGTINRDSQGKVRDKKGQYASDPERLKTDLARSSLRTETKQSIYSEYTRLADGSYMHKSGKIIKPPVHIGHTYGWENRRLLKAADEVGMTQQQLNDYVNSPSRTQKLFQLENAKDNLSHKYEKPGIDDLQKIKDDMLNFLNSRNKK